jgi:ketosteroid isomerase-like protein
MSQENVETMRRGLAAFSRRDKAGWVALCDPEVESVPAVEFPENAPIRGAEAVWEALVEVDDVFDEGAWEWGELIDAGKDKVVANQLREMLGRASGAGVAWSYWVVCTFRDGRLLRMEWFADRSEALKAGFEESAMSAENVDLITRHADAATRQDVDAFLATVSPDVEWEDAMFWSEPMRVYRGREEVREWFERAVVEPWESVRWEAEEVIPAGEDCIAAGGVNAGRGRGSGAEVKVHGWMIFWISDGLITRRQAFLDRADALEAAGLSE